MGSRTKPGTIDVDNISCGEMVYILGRVTAVALGRPDSPLCGIDMQGQKSEKNKKKTRNKEPLDPFGTIPIA
jgi:hypothetical protein